MAETLEMSDSQFEATGIAGGTRFGDADLIFDATDSSHPRFTPVYALTVMTGVSFVLANTLDRAGMHSL